MVGTAVTNTALETWLPLAVGRSQFELFDVLVEEETHLQSGTDFDTSALHRVSARPFTLVLLQFL